jgi:hypothetical protein
VGRLSRSQRQLRCLHHASTRLWLPLVLDLHVHIHHHNHSASERRRSLGWWNKVAGIVACVVALVALLIGLASWMGLDPGTRGQGAHPVTRTVYVLPTVPSLQSSNQPMIFHGR